MQDMRQLKPQAIIDQVKTSDVFTAEKRSVAMVYLKGIGKFCIVCERKLQPKIIIENRRGKLIRKIQPIRKDQKFCSSICSHKYMRMKGNQKNNSIPCRINMTVINGIKPYREMKLYLKKGTCFTFKITSESKELWDYLERIDRHRNLKQKEVACLVG